MSDPMKAIVGKLLGVVVLCLAWALALGASVPTARTPADVSAAPPGLADQATDLHPPAPRARPKAPKLARAPRAPEATRASVPADGTETEHGLSSDVEGSASENGEVDLLDQALVASRRISAAAEAARLRSATNPDEESAASATPE